MNQTSLIFLSARRGMYDGMRNALDSGKPYHATPNATFTHFEDSKINYWKPSILQRIAYLLGFKKDPRFNGKKTAIHCDEVSLIEAPTPKRFVKRKVAPIEILPNTTITVEDK